MKLTQPFPLMDEAADGAGGGGGDLPDVTVDIDAASDAIGADLGFTDKPGTDELLDSSATPSGEKKTEPAADASKPAPTPAEKLAAEKLASETKAKALAAREALKVKNIPDLDKKTDEEVLKLAEDAAKPGKPRPKSWGEKQEAVWSRLPPEAQDYIEQREAQVTEGIQQYAAAAKYADHVFGLLEPHKQLFTAQGVKNHGQAITGLVHGHVQLSTLPATERAAYFANLAYIYGVDMAAAVEAHAKGPARPAQPSPESQRIAALEKARAEDQQHAVAQARTAASVELENFKGEKNADGSLKHEFFNEVADDMADLIQVNPKLNLGDAYDKAVYANPVTRAKMFEKAQAASLEKQRKADEEKATAAAKARGLKVKGEERERASPDLVGSMDQTMRETMADIKARQ